MSAFTDTEKKVAKVIVAGLKNGLTEARSLESAGLLLTDTKRLEIGSKTLLDIADLLEQTTIMNIVPQGRGMTPNDVKRSIAEWIVQIAADNDPRS